MTLAFALMALSLLTAPANAQRIGDRVLVTVVSTQAPSEEWSNQVCRIFQEAWNQPRMGSYQDVQCLWLKNDVQASLDAQEFLYSGNYALHVQIRDFSNMISLQFKNLARLDQFDFQRADYRIDKSAGGSMIQVAQVASEFRQRYQALRKDGEAILKSALIDSRSTSSGGGMTSKYSINPNQILRQADDGDKGQEVDGLLVFKLSRDLYLKFSQKVNSQPGLPEPAAPSRRSMVREATLIYIF